MNVSDGPKADNYYPSPSSELRRQEVALNAEQSVPDLRRRIAHHWWDGVVGVVTGIGGTVTVRGSHEMKARMRTSTARNMIARFGSIFLSVQNQEVRSPAPSTPLALTDCGAPKSILRVQPVNSWHEQIYPKAIEASRVYTALSLTSPGTLNGGDEDLSVTDLTGLGDALDRVDGFAGLVI